MSALQAAHEAHKARRARMAAAAIEPVPNPIALPMIVKQAPVEDIVEKSLAVYADDLRAVLKGISRRKESVGGSISDIVKEMVAVSGVSRADIVSHRRIERVVIVRQFAMWRVRNETTFSYAVIGKAFGGRDHTTVLHASRKTEERIAAGKIPQSWLDTVRSYGNG